MAMRSARSDDVTARARIRDAGVLLFGHDGYERASVRAVASAAGVSPALVIHHFGSKNGLRVECNRYVAEEFLGRNEDLIRGPEAAVSAMERWLTDIEQFQPLIDYLARMLSEESAAADELFDVLLAGTSAMLSNEIPGRRRVAGGRWKGRFIYS